MLTYTDLYKEIIEGNKVEEYIKENGQLVDDASLSLVEFEETSILINCYWDEDQENWKYYFEVEDEGHLDFYDTFEKALIDYKRLLKDKYTYIIK
jgi:hypothetical protein